MSGGNVQLSWPEILLGSPGHWLACMLAAAGSWNDAISFQLKMLLLELIHLVNKMLQTSSVLAA